FAPPPLAICSLSLHDALPISDRLRDRLGDLQHQPGAVLDRSAIGIGALVGAVLGELVEQIAVGAMNLDAVEAGFDRVQRGLLERDRKSTRLNSSHVKISYAVF